MKPKASMHAREHAASARRSRRRATFRAAAAGARLHGYSHDDLTSPLERARLHRFAGALPPRPLDGDADE